ncbi:two-partner secretion domain-containing protein [Dongshaea marina]|uniref:two-partner secretion domain-containing protein n=1 Tax=Dongshaea marina TaxID=2047966 RepID=UPI000D3E3536|nr:filamentous hemagglutinin N-terminal domain-containing protein [Dongshaea marina]
MVNRVYRVIWSAVHRTWIVVSELARAHKKQKSCLISLTLAIGALNSPSLHANSIENNTLPSGAQIAAGSAQISQQQAKMTITQHSDKLITNWDSFNIGQDASVTFKQPSASSSALNRVTGQDPSQILGRLSSNGQLILVNPSGIVFGAGAQVNVGSIIASTLNISDQAFKDGNNQFKNDGTSGEIVNQGSIQTPEGGSIALIAPVVRNEGKLNAPQGSITLAAADEVTIDFFGDGLAKVKIHKSTLDALAENKGLIQADGGLVVLTADATRSLMTGIVNNSGIIEANSLTEQGGRIVLGGGLVTNTGVLAAKGVTGIKGGQISIEGEFVAMGGEVDASGSSGGSISISANRALSLADNITAAGHSSSGGSIHYSSAGRIIESSSSSSDASGATDGGNIRVEATNALASSGNYSVEGQTGAGGALDITAQEVRLLSSTINASGHTRGGKVRVGGEFQGGKPAPQEDPHQNFRQEFSASPALTSSKLTFINDSSQIDVSAADGRGGSAVIWSNNQTTQLGRIDASGNPGGFIEISSALDLRHAGLEQITLGNGGTLLLDPKNIIIGDYSLIGSWSYQAILGVSYPNNSASDGDKDRHQSLDNTDYFGTSVALNSAGTLLAVGAELDHGFSNTGNDIGAVYLYSFSDNNFSDGKLVGIIGSGYNAGNHINLNSKLSDYDQFGSSVALNDAGDRLAVGAKWTDNSSGGQWNTGAVYLFTFSDTSFSGGALALSIGDGFSFDYDLSAMLSGIAWPSMAAVID